MLSDSVPHFAEIISEFQQWTANEDVSFAFLFARNIVVLCAWVGGLRARNYYY